jgi:hypothetical protein
MKTPKLLLSIYVLIASISYSADAMSSNAELVPAPLAAALGSPETNQVEAIQERLSKEWIGKSRDEIKVCINQIIQKRGDLGAVKNGKQSMLSLSSKDASFRIHIGYDAAERASSVKCSLEQRK